MAIRLDRSKPFSECRGERQPDDPHYRVHSWQGQKVGKAMVLLPFDSSDELVPDDGKTGPYPGAVDGKPVLHFPLYTDDMRKLVEMKLKRQKTLSVDTGDEGDDGDDETERADSLLEEVNFALWLRGEARYDWALLQVAAKARFSRVFTSKREMVMDLVLDEKVVPEDQVHPELAKLLPARVTA